MAPSDLSSEFFTVSLPIEYVARVEINRPKKLNSFTHQMFTDLGAVFKGLSHDPNVRAIILTAAGDRAFTAGLDITAASSEGALSGKGDSEKDVARKAWELRRHIKELQEPINYIESCEKPVICVSEYYLHRISSIKDMCIDHQLAVHGISYGAAIDISTCCDVRLCSNDTRFSVREVAIGLAADLGTLTRLGHTGVPMSWIKDVALTARDFSAQEALTMGFVSGVYDSKAAALDRAMELAKDIVANSPIAVQSTKAVINYSRDHSVADGEKSSDFSMSVLEANCSLRLGLHSRVECRHVADTRCKGRYVQQDGEEDTQVCEVVRYRTSYLLSRDAHVVLKFHDAFPPTEPGRTIFGLLRGRDVPYIHEEICLTYVATSIQPTQLYLQEKRDLPPIRTTPQRSERPDTDAPCLCLSGKRLTLLQWACRSSTLDR